MWQNRLVHVTLKPRNIICRLYRQPNTKNAFIKAALIFLIIWDYRIILRSCILEYEKCGLTYKPAIIMAPLALGINATVFW